MKKHIKNFNRRRIDRGSLERFNIEDIPDANIGLVKFNETEYEKKTIKIKDLLAYQLNPAYNYWFIVNGIEDDSLLMQICNKFHIHAMVANNIINTSMRPCIDNYKNFTSIIFKDIKSNIKDSELNLEIDQIGLILGENFLISFTEAKIDNFEKLYFKVENSNIKKRDVSFVSYLILDHIIENYFITMEEISDKIEEVEKNIISNPDKKSIEVIHNIKNDLLMLHKVVWSQRDSINTMLKERDFIERDELRIYLRDLYDHLFQINDIIEIFRDRLSSMLDIYLSGTSMKMNETMKVLAIISTVFMPLTFIAGIYGMNFAFMPELQMKFGYPVVLLVMALLSFLMIKYFKKNNWF